MVKVLPTTFTLFESQNIFNAPAEPLCIHCSEQYVFIACEGCIIEAHNLATNEKISRLRTIWPVNELVYNTHGDCVVTLERRNYDSPAAARIYFKWRGIREMERPMRVVSLGSPRLQRLSPIQDVDAEIVELPADSVSCLAVCELTGTIAVGSEKIVRLFVLQKEPTATVSTGGYKVITYMDICTDMRLKKICISGHFIACVSTHRIRVLKFFLLGSENHPWSQFQMDSFSDSSNVRPKPSPGSVIDDDHFVCWSPSYIWETEAKMVNSGKFLKPVTPAIPTGDITPPSIITTSGKESEGDDHVTSNGKEEEEEEVPLSDSSTYQLEPHSTSNDHLNIGTITLPAVKQSMSEVKRDVSKHELEVLGPVEYVWGQPLSVVLHKEAGTHVKCWVLTMLYRRLASSGFAYVYTMTHETKEKSATLGSADPLRRRATTMYAKSEMGGDIARGRSKGGIHSVQLVPTFAQGITGGSELAGMACIIANRARGHIYDVYRKTRLVSSVSFMTRCQMVSYDGQFLHAMSTDSNSVDSYTSRVGASVITNQDFVTGEIIGKKEKNAWMKQPCPPTSLELTLISSNKFIGCLSLASSSSHVVVLCICKQSDPSSDSTSQETPGRQSFLQSLSLRRPKPTSSISWNIYALEKKSILAMFQQFSESAENLGEGAPPVLQHHLSEAHLLLRPLVIQNGSTEELTTMLQTNCFKLADALCLYSADKMATMNAAGYLVLSGRPIHDVIQYIMNKYPEMPTRTPFTILLNYLNLVLFEPTNRASYYKELQPLANQILELYTKYDCDRLPEFVLYSWLKSYSREKALELLQLLLPRVSNNPQLSNVYNLINLAISFLLCELNLLEEAKASFSVISESFLLSWTKEHPQYLLDIDNNVLTPMGEVIMNGFDKCFLSVISHLLETEVINWNTLCLALKVSEEAVLLHNQILKHLLDSILTGKVVLEANVVGNAALLLVELLLARIITDDLSKSSTPIQFGRRYAWLNKMPPFESSLEDSTDSVLYISSTSQSALHDLRELQSFLCSHYMNEEIASHVDQLITKSHHGDKDSSSNNMIIVSIQLLCWPYINKLSEASRLILDYCPLLTVEYCKCFYKTNLLHWKNLLEELLKRIDTISSEMIKQSDIILNVYQDTLLHVVTLTSPEEFFALLPSKGNLLFFLPAIEQSCKLYIASNITSHLKTVVKETELSLT